MAEKWGGESKKQRWKEEGDGEEQIHWRRIGLCHSINAFLPHVFTIHWSLPPCVIKTFSFPLEPVYRFFSIPLFLHFLHPSFPPPLHQLLSTPSHSTASICLYVLLVSPCCSCHLLFTHAWMIVRTLLYLCHISHTVSLLFLLIFFFPPMCFLFLPVLHLLVNVHLCGVCFLKQVSPCSSFPNYLQNWFGAHFIVKND